MKLCNSKHPPIYIIKTLHLAKLNGEYMAPTPRRKTHKPNAPTLRNITA